MSKKITIIDYGVGNILSIKNAFSFLGEKANYSNDPKIILNSTHVILPGVGSFPAAMEKLQKLNLIECIKKIPDSGIFMLGICLGMQLLFEKSYEQGKSNGLALLNGEIEKISKFSKLDDLKVPHIGWNSLIINKQNINPLLKNINKDDFFYFVHSFALREVKKNYSACYTEYSKILFPSLINYKNIFGCQFHPERSGKSGIKVLNNFLSL
jgi:glutamine amidotransferase